MKKLLLILMFVCVSPAAFAAEPDYVSPFRATWKDELAKDATLRAEIKDALRITVHDEESEKIATNNKHVAIAYGAIWVLTLVFVGMLWQRHGRLRAELDRLRAELDRAAKEDAPK